MLLHHPGGGGGGGGRYVWNGDSRQTDKSLSRRVRVQTGGLINGKLRVLRRGSDRCQVWSSNPSLIPPAIHLCLHPRRCCGPPPWLCSPPSACSAPPRAPPAASAGAAALPCVGKAAHGSMSQSQDPTKISEASVDEGATAEQQRVWKPSTYEWVKVRKEVQQWRRSSLEAS